MVKCPCRCVRLPHVAMQQWSKEVISERSREFPSEVVSSELHCRICYSRRHFKMAERTHDLARPFSNAHLECAGILNRDRY